MTTSAGSSIFKGCDNLNTVYYLEYGGYNMMNWLINTAHNEELKNVTVVYIEWAQ